MRENLSLGVSIQQQRRRPACTCGQSDQHLFCLLFEKYNIKTYYKQIFTILTSLREHSGSVVARLTRDRGAAGSSLSGVSVMCP